jgi:hypothetical protein
MNFVLVHFFSNFLVYHIMMPSFQINEPFQFNPLKHHLVFIKEFISNKFEVKTENDIISLVRELKHIGASVMDIYYGKLSVREICSEVSIYLEMNLLLKEDVFSAWTGLDFNDFRLITLSDSSQWILKYHKDAKRFVHIFPARSSPLSFRVRANSLKSAIIYYILIGKDFISGEDLNKARAILGLSPIKDAIETEAITEMIEILRH